MGQSYLIYLLGFDVVIKDRRGGETKDDFIVITAPEEHPDDLTAAHDTIRGYYSHLGYDVKEIKYKDSKVKELDLKAEYAAAQTTAQHTQ